MDPEVQRVLGAFIKKGTIKKEDAVACVREGEKRGENPLSIAVKRGFLKREDVQRVLATTLVDPPSKVAPSTPSSGTPRPKPLPKEPPRDDPGETLDLDTGLPVTRVSPMSPAPHTPPTNTPQPPTKGSKHRPRKPGATEKDSDRVQDPAESELVRVPRGPKSPPLGVTQETGPPVPFAPQQFGPYELVKLLGEGGMGVVYEAHDRRLGRNVALKMLHMEKRRSAGMIARFLQEARSAARLKHPNVCPVYEVGNHAGVPFYTMELITGPTLLTLKEQGWRRILEVTRDAALGLAHAHEAGIIHRDVKPTNILVDQAGTGRLVDFGLAADLALEERPDRLTHTGQFLGTPAYLAPECISQGSRIATARSDVYSLGVTLYEALSGKLPFDATTTIEMFREVVRGKPVPLELPEGAPADIEKVTTRALMRDPTRRYETAAALAQDVEKILAGEALAPEAPGPSPKKSSLAPLIVAGVVLASIAIGIAIAVALKGPSQPPAPAPSPTPAPSPSIAATPTPTPLPSPEPSVEPSPERTPPPDPSFGPPPSAETLAKLTHARELVWTGDLAKARTAYHQALNADPRVTDAVFEDVLVARLMHEYIGTPGITNGVLAFIRMPTAQVIIESALVPDLPFGMSQMDPRIDVTGMPAAALLLAVRAKHFEEMSRSQSPDNSERCLERAEELGREALRQKPRCGWIAAVLAGVLSVRRKADEALKLLAEDRDYDGFAAQMRRFEKGYALVVSGKVKEGEATLAEIIDPPYAVIARSFRLDNLHYRADATGAALMFQGEEPSSARDALYLGRCFLALEKPDEARRFLDMGVDAAENGGDIVGLYRACKRSKDQLKVALFSQRYPEGGTHYGAEARGLRARLAAKAKDFARAEADIARMKTEPGLDELDRQGMDTRDLREIWRAEKNATEGTIALVRGDTQGACRAFDAAEGEVEDYFPADAHLDRATARLATGDVEGAIAACTSAQRMDPVLTPLVKKKLAEIEAKKGK